MREEARWSYGAGAEDATGEDRRQKLLTIALAWTSARNARDRALGADLFVNPAWDILLELFVDHLRGKRSAVTKVCLSSTAPLTTALRWVTALEAQRLVERVPDAQDRRRTFLLLTPEGIQGMELALEGAAASDARLGLGRMQLAQ